MAFACLHIPDFLVQSMVRAEPALGDCAIALISGAPPLWNVVAANPAAFQAGIQLGMTKSQVAEFCDVQIRYRSESQEKIAHAALLDVGRSISPRVEDTAPDTIILDLDGLTSLFGSDENVAHQLERRLIAVGLVPRIAVASNIEVAIHAARGFPGITVMPASEEFQRLGNLPVRILSTGPEVLEILERWGVDTLQALAALPVLQLSERLGQEGVRLHELARGACTRSLILAPSVANFEEEIELDDAVEELEPLSFLLGRLLDQLCARLEARALAIHAVHVRFDLEPSFENDLQSLKDNSRKKIAAKHYTKLLTLPVPMRDSKLLLKLLRLQLQADPPLAPIQKIILTADSSPTRVVQGGLFVPYAPDPEKLELTIARLAKLVGDSHVGSPELLDTHRPENYRISRFLTLASYGKASVGAELTTPASGPRAEATALGRVKSRRKSGALSEAEKCHEAAEPICGFRVSRPPVPVTVELREERPVYVCLRGIHGEVLAASGPWRSSGDWWQEDAWHQDEWDLAIDFCASHEPREQITNSWPQYGIYRIYYDAFHRSWFVRGFYD
jgi:protein ImuB